MPSNESFEIAADSPEKADVQELLAAHLRFANQHSPREDVHALDASGLLGAAISFFSIRVDGALLGVGAIKRIDGDHAELKSIHTAEQARGRGVGRAMVNYLIDLARQRGFSRVSLETGSMEAFAPSRQLYEAAGFEICAPFAGYGPSPNSTFMTLVL
jgi:putative acetyltransferase